MARSTMSELITRLRSYTQAGTADYSVAGVTYWTDDQLQAVLDRFRLEIYMEPLVSVESYSGGTAQWINYQSAYTDFESTNGGTAIFEVEDGAGVTIGTANYTPDYPSGRLVFAADTGGSALYLTGRSYDVFGAAADVWRQKSGQYALAVDFSTDNHSIKRGAIIQQCQSMADYYQSKARPRTVDMDRGDYAWS